MAMLKSVFCLLLFGASILTSAQLSNFNFEIDGNRVVNTNGKDDWLTVVPNFARNVAAGTCYSTGTNKGELICDTTSKVPSGVGDCTTFKGGAKESDPTTWLPFAACGSVTPKDDITNIYAVGLIDAINNKAGIAVAAERLPKSGDMHISFEFSKNVQQVQGQNVPQRSVGDIQISFNLGGSVSSNTNAIQIAVFVAKLINNVPAFDYANPDFDASGSGSISSNVVAAALNLQTLTETTAWKSYDASGAVLVDSIDPFGFFEALVDVSFFNPNVCFNYVTVKTRSSTSLTSQLKDTTATQEFPFCSSLTVKKFLDYDADGQFDSTKGDVWASGWKFNVQKDNLNVNVTTGSDGSVEVQDLVSGNYMVKEFQQDGYVVSKPPGSLEQTATVAAGVPGEVTFGNRCKVNLLVTVNGISSGSFPASSYKLTLSGSGFTTQEQTLSSSGTATFSDLTPFATYSLVLSQSTAGSLPPVSITINDYVLATCSASTSITIPTYTILGHKFKDTSADGLQGTTLCFLNAPFTEKDLAGVEFTLKSGTTALGTATSAADGSFSFANVGPGTYQVVESAFAGYEATTPTSKDVTVTLGFDAAANKVEFGNTPLAQIGVTFSGTGLKSQISCTKVADGSALAGSPTNSGTFTSAANLKAGKYACTVEIVDSLCP